MDHFASFACFPVWGLVSRIFAGCWGMLSQLHQRYMRALSRPEVGSVSWPFEVAAQVSCVALEFVPFAASCVSSCVSNFIQVFVVLPLPRHNQIMKV